MVNQTRLSSKKTLRHLLIIDLLVIMVTLSYFTYMNYLVTYSSYISCPAVGLSQNQINRTILLQYVNFAEYGLYSRPGCVSLSIQHNQTVYNKYNISVNVTQLESLITYRAFWHRSIGYMAILLIEIVAAVLLFIIYQHK